MRLISCHIENFGKLQDCSVNFEEDLHAICEQNGWGKSTFAAFIRAMFYGLDGERKRSIEENERKRYKPWQGGVFGGQLVFTVHGRKYEIARIFHDKEANDEFELRDADTNLISEDYSRQIGEEIFGVGRESFLRSIYIGQSACETNATDDISAKIGNITENTNDLNNYENASAQITELLNRMTPLRKTGSLAKRKEEITQLEREVSDGQGIGTSLEQYQKLLLEQEEQYVSDQARLEDMTAEQKKAVAMQSVLAKKEEWERLKKTAQDKQRIVEEQRNSFPKEIPTMEQIQKLTLWCGEEEKIQERIGMTRLSAKEKQELETLDDCFQNGIPENGELENKIREAAQYRKLQQEYSREQLNDVEQRRYEQLEPLFQNEREPVSVILGKWNERNNRKAALPSKQAMLATMQSTKAKEPRKNPVTILAGAVLLVGAILLCLRSLWIPGVLLLLVGAVFVGLGCRNSGESDHPETMSSVQELEQEILQDTTWIQQVDAETRAYLEQHGKVYDEYMVSTLLQQILEESVEYQTLQKRAEQMQSAGDWEQIEALGQAIAHFLQQYQQPAEEKTYEENLYALRERLQRYQVLAQQESRYQAAQAEWKQVKEQMTEFVQTYGFSLAEDHRSQVQELQERIRQYYYAKENQEEALQALKQFEAQLDVHALEEEGKAADVPDLDELNAAISGMTQSLQTTHKTITEYQKTLERLGIQYDEWEEQREQLEQLKLIQEEEKKRFHYLKLTQTKLSQAKESLTSRYTAPVLASFKQYYTAISGQMDTDFHMDANIIVTVKEQGKQRDVNTLSAGYQDLIGICLRLAFVDAMYEKESPILILDDPFTNLDDKKMIAAKRLLKMVARRYQVIYFTCSEARNVGDESRIEIQ